MESTVLNSENIKTITDYINYNSENGIFVRIVGEGSDLLPEINKMDAQLSLLTLSGTIAYKRISSLPNISEPSEIDFYNECYSDFVRSGRKRVLSKRMIDSDKSDEKLASALREVTSRLKILRPMMTDSMEKNAVIKLLYRFDEVMKGFSDREGFHKNVKLVGDNITKEQDYLFFYLMSLLGINVLLIQNRSDIDIYQKQLKISAVNVMGHLGQSVIPEYREPQAMQTERSRIRQRQSENVNNNMKFRRAPEIENRSSSVRVTIPPRPRKQKPIENNPPITNNVTRSDVNQTPPSQGIKVVIPPRPGRSGTSSQYNGSPAQSYTQSAPRIPPPPVRRSGTPPQPTPTMRTPSAYNSDRSRNAPPYNLPQRREMSYEQLARLAASIVQIMVFKNSGIGGRGVPCASGSGIMIGPQGYILTNCHVTDSGRYYGVRIENDNNIYYTDRVIKYHRDLDLSVIRIEKFLNPLPIYRGREGLSRGQRVVAIGSPLGMFNTVSDGIISGFREIDGVNMIQFTAPISAGSSGGAVLNMFGEVIGISTAGLRNAQNINLAVPYDEIAMFCMNFL